MAMELRKRSIEALSSKAGIKFKVREIATWICDNYPEDVSLKLATSGYLKNRGHLISQLGAEIGANFARWQRTHPELRSTEDRPRLYYWTSKSEEAEVEEAEREGGAPVSGSGKKKIREHDLYPILGEFVRSRFAVHAYRIDERRSSNSGGFGGNKWLFPDVVGMENLTEGLSAEVVASMRECRSMLLKLWSFEVKILINRSNARQSYSQAVTNSTWAHRGYLAAAEFEGRDTMSELHILHGMHGIGVIKLNIHTPEASEILIPATVRPEIQWPMCNRLVEENTDFAKFMTIFRQFFQTGAIQRSELREVADRHEQEFA
jgi:hypothetical protein